MVGKTGSSQCGRNAKSRDISASLAGNMDFVFIKAQQLLLAERPVHLVDEWFGQIGKCIAVTG